MKGLLAAAHVVLIVALPCTAQAQTKWEGSRAFGTCVDAANGVDSAMAFCARDEFDLNDALLNAAYAARMKDAEDALKTAIKTSQKAWIAYRDTTCDAEGAVYTGGTLEPFARAECEARLTSERTDWLKGLTQ